MFAAVGGFVAAVSWCGEVWKSLFHRKQTVAAKQPETQGV